MTDYKQLCAELVDAIDSGIPTERMHSSPLVLRARAALAEPEPEEPTDEELWELYDLMGGAPEDGPWGLTYARAVLARWGRPTPHPIPVSERLPGPDDCDAEGLCWCWHAAAYTWGVFRLDLTAHSHWLPAHVLPLPS